MKRRLRKKIWKQMVAKAKARADFLTEYKWKRMVEQNPSILKYFAGPVFQIIPDYERLTEDFHARIR